MLRALLFTALLASETAAYACQCDDPATMTEAEQEERARWIAGQSMVIAEVERTTPMSSTATVMTYKVVRPLVGASPKEISWPLYTIRLPDGRILAAPSTSCDYWGVPGRREVMAFIAPPPNAPDAPKPCSVFGALASELRPAGMCVQFSVQNPGMVDRIRRILAERKR